MRAWFRFPFALCLLLLLAGGGFWFFLRQPQAPLPRETEALLSPGRTPGRLAGEPLPPVLVPMAGQPHRGMTGAGISSTPSRGREWGAFRILSSSPGELSLAFSLPEYRLDEEVDGEGRAWSVARVESIPLRNCQGRPQVPWFSFSCGFPPGVQVSLEVREGAWEERKAPPPRLGAGPALHGAPPPNAPTEPGEGSEPLAWLSPSFQLRGIQGRTVSLSPFQYDGERGVYRILTRGTLVLRSTAEEFPTADAQGDFAQLQRAFFANGDSFREAPSTQVGTLGIVVPSEWRDSPALDDFVAWRQSLGWRVLLAEYPLETGEGRDAILQQARLWYQQEQASHLLLLGDLGWLPPYQFSSNAPYSYRGHCTDVPYALLEGEEDKSYADLFLGRVPVDGLQPLETYLEGVVRYEQGEEGEPEDGQPWSRRALFLGSADVAICWPYQDKTDWESVEAQGTLWEESGILDPGSPRFYDSSATSPLYCPDQVAAAVDQGASLLLYLGHASCINFTTTGFDARYARRLAPRGHAPFWLAPACMAGRLDHARPQGNDDCSASLYGTYSLGQALFQNSSGDFAALGAVMGSGSTFWDPTIVQVEAFGREVASSRGQSRLATLGAYAQYAMAEAVAFCENYRDAYREAKASGETTMDNGGYTAKDGIYHAWSMAFLGDPSALLRIGPQEPLQVDCQWNGGSLHCQVTGLPGTDGEPRSVPQAAVALALDDAVLAGRTDETGGLALKPPQGSLEESLWAELRVLDASGPFLRLRIATVDADGDGAVTNGEMHRWLLRWREEFAGAEESPEARSLLAAAVRQWQEGVPPGEGSSEGEPEAVGEVPAPRLLKMTLPLSASLLEEAAGAGLPLLSRREGAFVVRVNQGEHDWLLSKGVEPLEVAPFPVEPPAREWASLQKRLEEMSRLGWPFFRLSPLGPSASGKPLLALRVSFQGEEGEPTSPLPHILLCAGASGDESQSVEKTMEFLEEAWEASLGGNPALRSCLEQCVLWVAPVLNPDGYDLGTPQNAAGVELEWGFPVASGTLAQGDPLGLDTPWRHPAREGSLPLPPQPEQKALARWLALHHPTLAVLLRQGDEALAGQDDVALALGDAWSRTAFLPPPVPSQERYPASTRLPQWIASYLEIPTLELSLPQDDTRTASALFLPLLEAALKGQGGTLRDGESQAPLPYGRAWRKEDGLGVRADRRGNFFLPLESLGMRFQAEGFQEGDSPDLEPSSTPLLLPLPERGRFLPGILETHRVLGKNIPPYSLARLSLPQGSVAASPGEWGAFCRQGDGFADFLWLEPPKKEDSPWEATLLLPARLEDDGTPLEEVAWEATLYADGTDTPSRRHLLLAPVRQRLPLAWKAGWNPLSVPLEGIPRESLGAERLLQWRQETFQPYEEPLLSPGTGLLAFFPFAGKTTLEGAWTDQEERPLEPGWHLLGPLSSHLSQDEEGTVFSATPGVFLLQGRETLVPGGAYWRHLSSPARVAP